MAMRMLMARIIRRQARVCNAVENNTFHHLQVGRVSPKTMATAAECQLTLGENAKQWTPRGRLRAKIAHEAGLGPNLHVARRAFGAIDQDSSNGGFVWIRDGELFESVIIYQFLAGLFRESCLRPRLHYTCSDQRFFDETPALGQRVCACSLFGNRSCPAQFWINLRIHFGERMDDLLRIIFVYYFDGLLFAGSIRVIEFRSRRRKVQRKSRAGTECRASKKYKREGEKFSHEAATYPTYRLCSQPIFSANANFLPCPKGVAGPGEAKRTTLIPSCAGALVHRAVGRLRPACCPSDGAAYLLPV